MRPTPEHTAFRDDLVAVIAKHDRLSPPEMLAVASQFVGQLIALQDQQTMRPDQALRIVTANLEIGNAGAIADLTDKPEGSA